MIGCLTTNIAAEAGRKESTGCAKCQLAAGLLGQEEKSSSMRMSEAQKATVNFFFTFFFKSQLLLMLR